MKIAYVHKASSKCYKLCLEDKNWTLLVFLTKIVH